MPGSTLHAPRFTPHALPSLSSPHICHCRCFSRYPSVSHDIPSASHAAELPIPIWGVEEQKAFPEAEHFRRKTMAPPVRACEKPGVPLTHTHSTLRTPFLLQLHSPPQPIFPVLLPSNPQAPPFLLVFLRPIAFLFRCLPTGKHVFNYTDVLFGVRRGFGVRERQGSSVPRESCGGNAG